MWASILSTGRTIFSNFTRRQLFHIVEREITYNRRPAAPFWTEPVGALSTRLIRKPGLSRHAEDYFCTDILSFLLNEGGQVVVEC